MPLPARDPRHSFQPWLRNVNSDMAGGSRGIDVPFSQLQCNHYWVEQGREGESGVEEDTLLPSLPYPLKTWNLYEINRYPSPVFFKVVLCPENTTASPTVAQGLLAGINPKS